MTIQRLDAWRRVASRLNLFISCSLLFLACGGAVPAPEGFTANPKRYHQALNQRLTAVKSLSGELSVEVWEKGKRLGLRQLFACSPPKRLRMDTLSPFEQPLATIIYNDQLLSVHDRESSRFMMGEASAENFERLTKLRIKPSDMSSLLSGQVPRITERGGSVKWDRRRGRSVLTLQHGQRRQTITFKEQDITPRVVELFDEDTLIIRVLLADYTSAEPKIPKKLRLEIPNQSVTVNTKLIDYTLNPKIPAAAFTIEAPPGLEPTDF